MMQTVSIVGGSNGGYAAAGDFADQGFDVQWYVRSPEHHREVLKGNRLTLRVSEDYVGRRTPGTERTVALDQVTTDLGAAIAAADVILVPLPTTTHRAVSRELAPHIKDGQTVVVSPGNVGSVYFRRAIDDLEDPPSGVVVAETSTLPYVARKSGPGEVTINLDAVQLPVGAFPGRDAERAHRDLSELYDTALAAENALDAALNNSNVGVNATPTIINAGAIDCGEFEFNVHRHGVTEHTLEVVLAIDHERVRLREALGYKAPHFTLEGYYEPGPETGDHFYGANAREALTVADTFSRDPPSLDDRYVHEDVRIATVLQASLGEFLDLETPMLDAILSLAEVMMGERYGENGRNLDALGFDVTDTEELEATIERGFEAA